MIIICPSCRKNFKVNESLIPNIGRFLKCGFCDHTWFFKKNDDNRITTADNIDIRQKKTKDKNEKISKPVPNFIKKKGSELVKYKPKYNFTFGKFLRYIIVFIISFISVIIVLDTFKGPLSIVFPNLELILYNLFETLRDLILFAKDLN